MRYLLDTNIVSDLVRNPQGRAAAAVRAMGESAVFTSIIVVAELRYGAEKKNSLRLTQQLETVLRGLEIVDFDAPADGRYATLRAYLEGAGTPIGPLDLLIAAHALALDSVLVTDNEREFTRVPGLMVENWLH